MKTKKGVLILFCLIFLFSIIPFISAAPPTFSAPTTSLGIAIEHPLSSSFGVNKTHKFHFHIFNVTDGKQIQASAATTCSFHLYDPAGNHILKMNYNVGSDDVLDYEALVTGGNFSYAGNYAFVFQCNQSTIGGFYAHDFEVTPNGSVLSTGDGIGYSIVFFLMLFFLGMLLFFFNSTESVGVKTFSIGFSYLLLIAISFSAWNMAGNYLYGTFFVGMFKILFYVLMAGVLPLFIGAFAYWVITLFKIKEIERLMEKGIDLQEAERRVGRKK